jgi:hypothetical protein
MCTRALRLLLATALLATGCSEIESLIGLDEDVDAARITLTADRTTLQVNETTTVSVQVLRENGQPVKDGAAVELAATLGAVDPARVSVRDGGRATATYQAGGQPGTAQLTAASGAARGELTLTVQAPAPPPPPAPPVPAPGAAPIDLTRVTWLDPNVSAWPETSQVTEATIGDPPICIRHTKAGRWPVKDGAEGNPWIFVNLNGQWYAATYEWLAPGQVCKGITRDNIGSHIGRAPLSSWRPRSGEWVGLMVSARARFRADTVQERSNIVMVQWP